jgi:ribosomal protein S18 acetylase RimI-like enzyme
MPQDPVWTSPRLDTDLRIRQARRAEADELARLETAAFAGDRLSRRSFAALARSASAILLTARRADALQGYVLVLTRRGGKSARLYSLAVAPEAAGRGIGSRLLAAAEAAAASRGAESLQLEVRPDNGAAIALYESRGYRRAGRRPAYYDDGSEALRYRRALRAAGRTGTRAAARDEARREASRN